MTPNNTPITPEIENIADENGDKHTVIPTQHSHSISEVTNLQSFITTYSHKIDKNNGNTYAYVEAMADTDNGKAKVEIGIEDPEEEEFSRKVSITWGNIKNLIRALLNPSTTPENTNDKLITSKAVFTALSNKADTTHTHYNITNSYYGSIGVYEDGETHNGCVSIRLWNEEYQQDENFAVTISALVNILQPDSTPIANSTKFVTSGGVKAALNQKVDLSKFSEEVDRLNSFNTSDVDEKINLPAVFDDDHYSTTYIIENYTSEDRTLDSFFNGGSDYLVCEPNKIIHPDSYVIAKVIKYNNGSNTLFFVVVEGIYEM